MYLFIIDEKYIR